MELHVALAKLGHRNAHSFEGLSIQDIQATATIHQNLGQSGAPHDWVDDQRLPPRGSNA